MPALPPQVSALIIIRRRAWRRGPNIRTQNNLVERKEPACWKTGAQQHLQVFWTAFRLLFLNAAFLMLCSLFTSVFFSLSSLVYVCLQKRKRALKYAVMWSILMVHDNYFNFLIHPCRRQSCTPLKCCLGSHWCARRWRVCFASWLKLTK